jgi:hypothetical protein
MRFFQFYDSLACCKNVHVSTWKKTPLQEILQKLFSNPGHCFLGCMLYVVSICPSPTTKYQAKKIFQSVNELHLFAGPLPNGLPHGAQLPS